MGKKSPLIRRQLPESWNLVCDPSFLVATGMLAITKVSCVKHGSLWGRFFV